MSNLTLDLITGQPLLFNKEFGGGTGGTDLTAIENRVTNLENTEYKITYYEPITISSSTSGSISFPSNTTLSENEFGESGNSVLSTLNASGKPNYKDPTTGYQYVDGSVGDHIPLANIIHDNEITDIDIIIHRSKEHLKPLPEVTSIP